MLTYFLCFQRESEKNLVKVAQRFGFLSVDFCPAINVRCALGLMLANVGVDLC